LQVIGITIYVRHIYHITYILDHNIVSITLWLFNITMGNGPFKDGLPIRHGDCPWLC
jgi:hypothetical protein